MPGTYVDALRTAGLWRAGEAVDLRGRDVWYRAEVAGVGPTRLVFEGLATHAQVWLDDRLCLTSTNMFRVHRLDVSLRGVHRLFLRFLDPALLEAPRKGRAKWRTRLSDQPWLRHVRTTLLGHMPEWAPAIAPTGPWRPVRIEAGGSLGACVAAASIAMDLTAGIGRVVIGMPKPCGDAPVWVAFDGGRHCLTVTADGTLAAEILVPAARVWWPHTHGAQELYPLSFHAGPDSVAVAPLGFRQVTLDRGADGLGFALLLNGVRVFCRGACWVPPDLVSLGGSETDYRLWLTQARDAGMNMIRVGGTMVYEAAAFYRLCDELGLMVWQDFMFANHDYPRDAAFVEQVCREAADFLAGVQQRCCIVVLCGGSEIAQQAAMMGLDARHWHETVADHELAACAGSLRPDVPYVAHSPGGGAVPFQVNSGVGHYYGVGAYLQPLGDARRAQVRFATECLALAHVPDHGSPAMPQWGRDWKRGVARDPGAAWDFEDVRDHYLDLLAGLDPQALRGADPDRYLDLSRAVSCALIEAVFGEWRSAGSGCGGGLVWLMRDLAPGAGWGVIDSAGRAKPAWFAMRRAFAVRAMMFTDETVNGLALHLVNDTDAPFDAALQIYSLRDGETPIARIDVAVSLAPRETRRVWLTALLGRFFDHTGVFRFGPPSHTATCAHLVDAQGMLIAEAFHVPGVALQPVGDVGLGAVAGCDAAGWYLDIACGRFAQHVHVRDAAFAAEEGWFHLSPLHGRRLRLRRTGAGDDPPCGEVRATNGRPVRYAGAVAARVI